MRMIRHAHKVFSTEAEAAALVTELQSAEADGWNYRVNVDPNGSGKAIVEIYDDEGIFVGLL